MLMSASLNLDTWMNLSQSHSCLSRSYSNDQEIPYCYGTKKVSSNITKASHCTPSWDISTDSHSHNLSLRYTSHILLDLQGCLFPWGFPIKILYEFLSSCTLHILIFSFLHYLIIHILVIYVSKTRLPHILLDLQGCLFLWGFPIKILYEFLSSCTLHILVFSFLHYLITTTPGAEYKSVTLFISLLNVSIFGEVKWTLRPLPAAPG